MLGRQDVPDEGRGGSSPENRQVTSCIIWQGVDAHVPPAMLSSVIN